MLREYVRGDMRGCLPVGTWQTPQKNDTHAAYHPKPMAAVPPMAEERMEREGGRWGGGGGGGGGGETLDVRIGREGVLELGAGGGRGGVSGCVGEGDVS